MHHGVFALMYKTNYGKQTGRMCAPSGLRKSGMGSLSIWHWLIVLVVVLVLFGGGGKISTIMGDMAKGIKSFKKHMADDEPMDDAPRAGSGHIAPPPAAATERTAAPADKTPQP